jgi:hypothetical protein
MIWVYVAVGSAAAGLAVLAWLSVRVWVAARGRGREVERTPPPRGPAGTRLRERVEAFDRVRG